MLPTSQLVRIGKALAHPARVRILFMLRDGETCGCEFTPALCLDASVVSRHLATLAAAGLVTSRRDGVRVLWSLADAAVPAVLEDLAERVREREVVG